MFATQALVLNVVVAREALNRQAFVRRDANGPTVLAVVGRQVEDSRTFGHAEESRLGRESFR